MSVATSQIKEKFEDYDGFVDKFKPKKTTDDCYTPPLVYDAVADWTAQEYGLDRSDFVRPFYPGGDYQSEDYTDKIVVDNPPFSCLSKIIDFYMEHGVRFLLFAPTLCGLMLYSDKCTVYPCGVNIEYENGATIKTSFCTNMDAPNVRVRIVPELFEMVDSANRESRRERHEQFPKYEYPRELVTIASIYALSAKGVELAITRDECVRVSALDSQRARKKAIFGSGLLVSDRVAKKIEDAKKIVRQRRRSCDREEEEGKRLVFPLSEREKAIVNELSNRVQRSD